LAFLFAEVESQEKKITGTTGAPKMAQFSLVGGFQPIRKHISQLGSIILSLNVVGG